MGKRIKFNKVIKLKRENVTPKQSIRAYGLHVQIYMLRIYVKYLYIKLICLCKFMTWTSSWPSNV